MSGLNTALVILLLIVSAVLVYAVAKKRWVMSGICLGVIVAIDLVIFKS